MTYKLKMVCEGMLIVEWSDSGATIHLIDAKTNGGSRDLGERSPLPKCAPYLAVPQGFWVGGDPPDQTQNGTHLYQLQDTAIRLESKGKPFAIAGPPAAPASEPTCNELGYFCWVPSLKEIEPTASSGNPINPGKIVATAQLIEGTLGSVDLSREIWSFEPEATVEHVLATGVVLELSLDDGDTLEVTLTEANRTRAVEIGQNGGGHPEVVFEVLNKPLKKVGLTRGAILHFKWNQEALKIPPPVRRRFAVPRHASMRTKCGGGIGSGEICPPTRYP